jgi:hypothetical protein
MINGLAWFRASPQRRRPARRSQKFARRPGVEILEDRVTPTLFGPTLTLGVGQDPFGIAAGNFTGNGLNDLAVVNQGNSQASSSISILLNHDGASFTPGQTISFGSDQLSAAVTGDFRGNGKIDIAVTDWTAGTVDVLLGNGDGTFQAPKSFATGAFPFTLATGDFFNDGKLDLAVVSGDMTSVSLLRGNGDGTFQAPVTALSYLPFAQDVAVADLNHDGNADLVVTAYNPYGNYPAFEVLLGHGDGTFTVAQSYSSTAGYTAVAVGDFNHDGNLDLALNGYASNTVGIFLGHGDGTFQNPVSYSVPGSPTWIAGGDFNADGATDLVTANLTNNTVTVLLSQGDGTFVVNGNYPVGNNPNYVITADSIGDGLPSLVVANRLDATVSLLVNQYADQLKVIPAAPTIAAGSSFTVTVQARDYSNAPSFEYTGTAHFTSSDPQAVLPADYTFTAADSGAHNFTVTLKTSGRQSITVTDTRKSSLTGQAATLNDFLTQSGADYPLGIITGPDGNLWFTEISGNRIGRMTPGGGPERVPAADGRERARGDHRRPGRQPVVHRSRVLADRADHHDRRTHRVPHPLSLQLPVRHYHGPGRLRVVHRGRRQQDRQDRPEYGENHRIPDTHRRGRARGNYRRAGRLPLVHRGVRRPDRQDRPEYGENYGVPRAHRQGQPQCDRRRTGPQSLVHREQRQ